MTTDTNQTTRILSDDQLDSICGGTGLDGGESRSSNNGPVKPQGTGGDLEQTVPGSEPPYESVL